MSDDLTPSAADESPATGSFFAARWRGEVPLTRLLWRDMLLVGTLVNLLTSFLGLMLFTTEAPTALAAAVYFSPLPYNVFLLAAVWRTADRAGQPPLSAARVIALAWLVLATLI